MKTNINRQHFIKASTAIAGFNLLPSGVWSQSPNSKLNVATIGYGSQGKGNTRAVAAHPKTEIVALCDPDLRELNSTGKKKKKKKGNDDQKPQPLPFAEAKRYQDYRKMFADMGNQIDAVIVATPDHAHCPATMAAMKLGKHVFTQKPLTHDIYESRQLIDMAAKTGLVTQMGIQCHSGLEYRMATHFLRQGVIGKIKKVYVWSGKSWGYDGAPFPGADPIPTGFDWNLYLGTAPKHPYHEGKYHRSNWRKFIDFGCGTLGDMGVHIYDTPFNGLGLEPPKWVMTDCRAPNGFGHPETNTVRLGFAPTERTTSDFEWIWYDGEGAGPGSAPDINLPEGQKLPKQGAFIIGEEGSMLLPHIGAPRFYPQEIHAKLEKPDLPKSINHYFQWVDTIL
ncbi:MAG: Gfo/Idh/MocA family oxidoreductase, partial [Kiritimatiellales bacterium]|nr:Gfo/Idh/MocA family oxidoreductase [Kiritimatiellales bacterium]